MDGLEENTARAYADAQAGLARLKSAVYRVLLDAGTRGLRNVDVGKTLGIYGGHVGHEGHIPRTLLAIMESEGVVMQDPTTKEWRLTDS